MMKIVGYLGVSLIDFPGKIATVFFTPGCNLRCPFCQNPDLVEGRGEFSYASPEDVAALLQERKGFVDGVSISGGEPTLQRELPQFLADRKNEGFLTKLDTNGYKPEVIAGLIGDGLLDFIAMDIKTSMEKYDEACGVRVDVSQIDRSIDLILKSGIPHEFRTTVVPNYVDSEDVEKIAQRIAGAQRYRLNQYSNRITYDPACRDIKPYLPEDLKAMVEKAKLFVENSRARGV